MTITRIDNIFEQKEIDHINRIIAKSPKNVHNNLGRFEVPDILQELSPIVIDKLNAIAKSVSDLPLKIDHAMCVEYNLLYGKPSLWPHLDGDTNDLIINIQLESNTVWDMGLNLDIHTLSDNSGLVFNANKETHWRVQKEFKDGEYVRMMFVRFYNLENRSDYSYLPRDPRDKMFDEVVDFRDRLGIF